MNDKGNLKTFDQQYQHAWNYFQLHANQRISLFGYYIIFLSIFAAGAGTIIFKFRSREISAEILGIIIALLFIGITWIFILLDERNKDLLEIGKKKLIELEKLWPDEDSQMLNRAEEKTTARHTTLLNIVFYGAIFAGLSYLIFAIVSCSHPFTC